MTIAPERIDLDMEMDLMGGPPRVGGRYGQKRSTQTQQPPPTDTKRRIDLVALDLDGTLLSSDKRLSRRAVAAVHEVRERGIKVVIATARPPRTVKEIYGHLKLNTHQINYNGGLIQHPLHEKYLRHQPISPDLAYAICTVARKTDKKCIIALEILDKWYTDKHDPTLVTETGKQFEPDYVGPLLEPLKQPVTKLMVMAPKNRMAIIRKTLHDRYASAATFIMAEDHLTQIGHFEADKGRALRFLCQKYKVEARHVLAMGDGPNDVGMLKFAGLGIAMDNGYDEAKAAADIVGPSNDEEGVAKALHKYILK